MDLRGGESVLAHPLLLEAKGGTLLEYRAEGEGEVKAPTVLFVAFQPVA